MAHSTVDLHLKELSELNKDLPRRIAHCKFLLHWAVHMRYKGYTRVSRTTYTHKIQPLHIRPSEPIASESVGLR